MGATGSMPSGFRENNLYKTVKYERDHFWPEGHKLNKLGRGLLDDDTYQISRFLM